MKKLLKVIALSFFVLPLIACSSTSVEADAKEAVGAPESEAPNTEEVDDEEYFRSTKQLSNGEKISKDQFAKDKAELLRIIDELNTIMEEKNYESWIPYISKDSQKFYKSPRKINNKGKIEVLNGLEDYFIELFIPSREKATINEIRYISSVSVKAGEFSKPTKANERPKFSTYYNFVKENGRWYVELPTNIVVK